MKHIKYFLFQIYETMLSKNMGNLSRAHTIIAFATILTFYAISIIVFIDLTFISVFNSIVLFFLCLVVSFFFYVSLINEEIIKKYRENDPYPKHGKFVVKIIQIAAFIILGISIVAARAIAGYEFRL